jgi:hypothetical protein
MKLISPKFLIGLCLIFLLNYTACRGPRQRGKSEKVDTYFKGPGELLFFVNPISLKGITPNTSGTCDFTYAFNQKDSLSGTIISNFSIVQNSFISGPYKAFWNTEKLDSVALMFAELKGNKSLTRITGQLTYQQFKNILNSDSLVLSIQSGEKVIKLAPTKKWSKHGPRLRHAILDVVEISVSSKR